MIKTYLACLLLLATSLTALAKMPPDDLAAARAEILPLFEAMQAAANAHDAEKHVSFYAREPSLLFVINDEAIVGYDPVDSPIRLEAPLDCNMRRERDARVVAFTEPWSVYGPGARVLCARVLPPARARVV